MAYNRENLLKKIIEIQNLVLELQHQNDDLMLRCLFWEYIFPQYHISYRTFHTYLGTNAKFELIKLHAKKGINERIPKKNNELMKGTISTIQNIVKKIDEAYLSVRTIKYKDGSTSQVLTIYNGFQNHKNKQIKKYQDVNYNIKNKVVTKALK